MANHLNQIDFDNELSHTSMNRANEHLTSYALNMTESLDSNNNTAQHINHNLTESQNEQPKLGLKLVLRRQSNNNYEITNNASVNTTSTNSTELQSNEANISKRPKREASRKVKFRFSDSEYEIDTPKPKRAKTTRTSNPSNLPQRRLSQQHQPQQIKKPELNTSQLNESLKSSQIDQSFEFTSNDIVNSSDDDKLKAYQSNPIVLIEHSRPLPICLVEDKTDIVCTKAVLFIHLFQTYSAQCIGCPLCKCYLNINEFSKHIHPDEDDESDDEDRERKKHQQHDNFDDSDSSPQKSTISYKILPYCISGELSDDDLKIWKLFSQRVALFKQAQTNKTKTSHVNKSQQQQIENNEKLKNNEENIEPKRVQQSSSNTQVNKENMELTNWDYVNTTDKYYVLTEHSINSDQIVYLDKNGDNYSKDVNNNDNKNLNIDSNNKQAYKRQLSDDLNLSESEDENEEQIKVKPSSKQLTHETECENTSLVNKKIRREPLVSIENRKNSLMTPLLEDKPSLDELYYNMYENLSKDKLFYIVDNQYTIIPDSYIYYVNKKREHYFKQLKLARSNYFQKKWLNLSLDLEFKIN